MSILDKIWIPRTAKPRYQCNICGDKFYANERVKWEHHTAQCAHEHHDDLQAAYDQARPPGFFKPFDPEYAAWAKKHGRIG